MGILEPELQDGQTQKRDLLDVWLRMEEAESAERVLKADETDLGNAQLFVELNKEKLLYCWSWKSWLEWDGVRFKRDDTGQYMKYAEKTAGMLKMDAEMETDPDRFKKKQYHAIKSKSVERLKAMSFLAQHKLSITSDRLDQNPDLIATGNCVVDLVTSEPKAPKQSYLMTRSTTSGHFPGTKMMECPVWMKCLELWTDNDKEMQRWLQKAAGYSLTGQTGEEVMFVQHGPPRSGKSKFLRAITDAMGDYARNVKPDALMRQRTSSDRADPEIAKLDGVRMVVSFEAEEGQRFAESAIKRLTGGDKVSTRNLYECSFDLVPQFKIWLATNYRPEASTDSAIWERLVVIPFDHYIPFEDRDPFLLDKLHEESPGILQWQIEGAKLWYAEGLRPFPKRVQTAIDLYREESNPARDWMIENTKSKDGALSLFGFLYSDYAEWCTVNHMDPISKQKMARILDDLGFPNVPGTGNRKYRKGIILTGQGDFD